MIGIRQATGALALALLASGALDPPRATAADLMCPAFEARELVEGPDAADLIFQGVARARRGDRYLFEPVRVFRGDPGSARIVVEVRPHADAPVDFRHGRGYLVLADRVSGAWTITPCRQRAKLKNLDELFETYGLRTAE